MRLRSAMLAAALAVAGGAWAASDDGRAFMERSERATKSRTEATRFRLDLIDAQGGLVQSREMTFDFKKLADKEATLVRFLSPPALRGTGLLIEDPGMSASDIWLYLPATRRLRRINGAEKTNWFLGTEFAHEDFEDYQLPLYRFALLDQVPCGTGTCQRVEAVASDPGERAASGYSRKIYSIDTATLYPVGIEYYGKRDVPIKRFGASDLVRQGNYWRPQTVVMNNLENGRMTRLTVLERTLDAPLDDYRVSARYLRAE